MTASGITLAELAHRLGGQVVGDQVTAPGPGHNDYDRSIAVRLSPDAPGGFVVHTFSPADDWQEARDWVRDAIGLAPGERLNGEARPAVTDEQRAARAWRLWSEGLDPRGSVVERYLASRRLNLPASAANRVIRYHPRCPWLDHATGEILTVPAMLAGMGSIESREVTAVHRTRLTPDGRKVDRRMLGVAAGTAIPLEHLGEQRHLVIGEGIETCLAGASFGFHPVWALASAGAIRDFPVLHGIDRLTILAEHDVASEVAVEACRARWAAAGRDVALKLPLAGKDFNDMLRELVVDE